MKKGLVIALSAVLFVACQKQTTPPATSTPEQVQLQALENTGKLVQFLNRRFQPHAENMRFESLPNFPFYGIETALEDALTATVCHKNPGAGERQVVYITPVFTFYPDQDETGKIVPGYQVQEFLNTCIDTILQVAQSLNFEGEGTLMVSMLDVREVSVTENSVTYQLDVHYLLQTEAAPSYSEFNYEPEDRPFSLSCVLFQTNYNPISSATLSLFDNMLNNPACNPNLRYRMRAHMSNINGLNPPLPISPPRPGFVYRLMYSGTIVADLTPINYLAGYTIFGPNNLWHAPVANSPFSVLGANMMNQLNGIAHRSMQLQPINLPSVYWDPAGYAVNVWYGRWPTNTNNQDYVAHAPNYIWQEWKWVPVPDPSLWTNISFEEGITSILNPNP
jgi:hypothetical protein